MPAEISVQANSATLYLTSDRNEQKLESYFKISNEQHIKHLKVFLNVVQRKETSNTSELSNYKYTYHRKTDKTI